MVNRPNAPLPPASDFVNTKLRARFWKKVSPAPADACWTWLGARNSRGYGNFGIKTGDGLRTYLAHRVAYEITHGPVPTGKDLDHLCKTKGCVNPGHLEPVTFLANMRRRYSDSPDERESHCVHGHPLTPENTLWVHNRSGRRSGTRARACRSCANDRKKEVG